MLIDGHAPWRKRREEMEEGEEITITIPMPVARLSGSGESFIVLGVGTYLVREIPNPVYQAMGAAPWLKVTVSGRVYGAARVIWEEHTGNGRVSCHEKGTGD